MCAVKTSLAGQLERKSGGGGDDDDDDDDDDGGGGGGGLRLPARNPQKHPMSHI